MCSSASCSGVTTDGHSLMKTPAALGFRKRHHLADRVGTAQEHRETIHAESHTAMRRRAVLKPLEEEPELVTRLLAQAQRLEHRGLDFLVVNSQAAPGEFGAVEHEIVGCGLDRAQVFALDELVSLGCGEVNG